MALERVLAPLGGMSAFVRPGQSVLIKPNLLADREPHAAVTTHPEVIRAVIRAVRAAGGTPLVGDSPGSAVRLEQVWKTTGVAAVCSSEGVALLNFEKAGSRQFAADSVAFTVAQPVLAADVVINLPKVKTHILTTLTAAVKNVYGTVPGYQKTNLHKLCPTPRRFGHLLLAIYSAVKPALHIADGVWGMEGDGPSAGRPVQLGFLAASADGIAMDMVLCRVLKIKPNSVPYLREILKKGRDANTYFAPPVAGEDPQRLAPPSFALPRAMLPRLIPGPLVRAIEGLFWIRPRFSAACVRCGQCVAACPAQALSLVPDQPKVVLVPHKCIGCCCCHEICPQRAVTMVQSWALRLARRGKGP